MSSRLEENGKMVPDHEENNKISSDQLSDHKENKKTLFDRDENDKSPSDLCGKLEMEIGVKATAEQFHHMWRHKPHHVPKTTGKIKGCELNEGDWGTIGSVITWNYFHEGKHKVAKHVVEEIDDEKNSITFKEVDGDLMEHYKSLKVTIRCTPKFDGEGSVVHWTIVYEKHHDEIVDPHTMLDFAHEVSKDLEIFLLQES